LIRECFSGRCSPTNGRFDDDGILGWEANPTSEARRVLYDTSGRTIAAPNGVNGNLDYVAGHRRQSPSVLINSLYQNCTKTLCNCGLGGYFEREADSPKLLKTLKTSSEGWSVWSARTRLQTRCSEKPQFMSKRGSSSGPIAAQLDTKPSTTTQNKTKQTDSMAFPSRPWETRGAASDRVHACQF